MSLLLQNPLSNSSHRIKIHLSNYRHNPTGNPKCSLSPIPSNPAPVQTFPVQRNLYLSQNRHRHIRAFESSSFDYQERENPSKLFDFDAFLSVLESLCVVSSLVIAVGCIVNWGFFRQHNSGLVVLGNRILVCSLAGAVAFGSVIRRRQWRRICGPRKSTPGAENGNVIERIEKLEESMRSANTIIRMLSRQLEKLGIRFRVTRKELREPISEAAALAQKNSEATRVLAVQGDILEKELAAVQKVLLAMQDQQLKQLELILAIAKSGKLLETKQPPSPGPGVHDKGSSGRESRQADGQQIRAKVGQSGATSEKALGS